MSSSIQYLSENTQGIDFVVGDLHGCHSLLMKSLNQIGFDFSKDRLLCCGDLIDRGPESLDCLKLLEQPWFFSVVGNHDDMMMKAVGGSTKNSVAIAGWIKHGGSWFFKLSKFDQDEAIRIIKKAISIMPLAIEVEVNSSRIGIVHAHVDDEWESINHTDRLKTLWSRKRIASSNSNPVSGIDMVIMGHTIVDSPIMKRNCLYIDTGAYKKLNQGENNEIAIINLSSFVDSLKTGVKQDMSYAIKQRMPDRLRLFSAKVFFDSK